MTDERAAASLYKGHSVRLCPDCGTPIGRLTRYCESDRARRRATTFLRAAYRAAEPLGRRAKTAIHEAELALHATASHLEDHERTVER